ncbi:MAG: 5-(carboxyamino)imidazole ribonucleotide synthase [Planctomycetes bacterium]|nr:5-(carboxyamino)imidazole ribonucleotide synthase [Planctomycetota bacterium]
MTTLGILGGGQLARMLALAAAPLGVRCRVLEPSPLAVAGHVAELVVGDYADPAALQTFAKGLDVVTFEFENVPAQATDWLQQHVPVAPPPRALAVGQDRIAEKTLFRHLGMLVPEFRAASTCAELHAAVAAVGAPCVVKTRRLGYDGKGQVRLHSGPDLPARIDAAFAELDDPRHGGLIVEAFVPFTRELSVIAVRGAAGAVAVYPLVENHHEGGILRRSHAPAPGLAPGLQRDAVQFATALLEHLDYRGVLAVELFECQGRLLANEMAPRVHNSGHWTIEGSVCSQFENHVRAVAGLPLGSTAMAQPAATMVNLIGELPSRRALLALPGVHVHAYGKAGRAGRKVGHATVVGSERAAVDAAAAAVLALGPGSAAEWGFVG